MIFDREPEDWRELEAFVQQMFAEMGCTAEVRRTIETVRGEVNIDVYVEDPTGTPAHIYLCECKHWTNAVPKTVVHAFRTVVADFGANRGFLISNAGFQSGAYEAAQKSNVELVTWDELQGLFLDRWVYSMGETLADIAEEIFPYIEPGNSKGSSRMKWNAELHARRQDLEYKYQIFFDASRYLYGPLRYRKAFPFRVPDPNSNAMEKGIRILNSYREFYDLAFSLGETALRELKTFYDEF